MKQSVLTMVRQVLSETKEKQAQLAANSGFDKTAAVSQTNQTPERAEVYTTEVLSKLANACDYLGEHLMEVVDQRSPKEKLAEYVAIQRELQKRAFEIGNVAPPEPNLGGYKGEGDKGEHQHKEAPADSQSPVDPAQDSGAPTPGGDDTAMKATPAMTQGENPAEAGETGEATEAHKPERETVPGEKPTEPSAPNAMETNKGMMMPEQPENVLKQAGMEGFQKALKGKPVQELRRMAARVKSSIPSRAGESALKEGIEHGSKKYIGAATDWLAAPGRARAAISEEARHRGLGLATRKGSPQWEDIKLAQLMKKAQDSHVPAKVAAAMVSMLTGEQVKVAEDAINPAVIVGGTDPELQRAAGIPSQLSQGYEAGEGTPRECAPNVGEGAGRELLSSIEAAINATKLQAKSQNKPALNEVLTEPAMSAAHDQVLDESLDNTSSAGVKISAARELLRKFASQSRENAFLVSELVKAANEMGSGVAGEEGSLSPEDLATASGVGEEGVGPLPEAGAEGAGAPSDEALEAAHAGVTPEELMQAHVLLASSEDAAGQAAEQEAAAAQQQAPVGEGTGEEQVGVKAGQFGMPGGSSGQGTSPSDQPGGWTGQG